MKTDSKGPFCQSCGMPLAKAVDFGTEADGSHSTEYCYYCYAKGAFVAPHLAMDEMLDICTHALAQQGMPKGEARAFMAGVLPNLKRWKKVPATA